MIHNKSTRKGAIDSKLKSTPKYNFIISPVQKQEGWRLKIRLTMFGGKRLKPVLREILDNCHLEASNEVIENVCCMSASTIDRLLKKELKSLK